MTIEAAVQNSTRIRLGDIVIGSFICTEEQYDNARKKLDFIRSIEEVFNVSSKGRKTCFQYALIVCYDLENVDIKRLKEKIQTYGYLIQNISTLYYCLTELEKVYNRNSKTDYVYIVNDYKRKMSKKLVRNLWKQ